MKDKKSHIYLDSYERSLLLHSLVELKNQLIQQGRYTDCVDELIFMVTAAHVKRIKLYKPYPIKAVYSAKGKRLCLLHCTKKILYYQQDGVDDL